MFGVLVLQYGKYSTLARFHGIKVRRVISLMLMALSFRPIKMRLLKEAFCGHLDGPIRSAPGALVHGIVVILLLNLVPTDQQRFIAHLKKGNKPKKTQSIPDDMYDIMKICLELNKWERKTFSELLVIFNSKLEEIEKEEKANSRLLPRRTSRAGTWKIPENFVKYRQETVDLFNDRSVSIVTNESEIPPPYSESVRPSSVRSSRRSTPSRTASPQPPPQTTLSGGGDATGNESEKLLTHSTTQYV